MHYRARLRVSVRAGVNRNCLKISREWSDEFALRCVNFLQVFFARSFVGNEIVYFVKRKVVAHKSLVEFGAIA